MTGIIKGLLKQYEPLADRYISDGALEGQVGTYAVVPNGKDYIKKQYTDGSCVRQMRFKVMGKLTEGRGEDIENLRLMQGISDYLCALEYPDGKIIGFKQISPPVMTHRASGDGTYEFTAEAIYKN